MKKLKWIAAGLLLVAVVVVVALLLNINAIVRSAVQTQSTASLGLETKLDSANVSLLGGNVKLNDFSVASPPGFNAPNFLELGGLSLQVSLSELRQDPVRISEIVISKPKLVIEHSNRKINLKAVAAQLPKPQPSGKEPVKVIIAKIVIEDPVVVIRPGIPGLTQELTLPLPTLTVTEIGTAEGNQNGVAIREVVTTVAKAMFAQAAASEKLPPEVRAILASDLEDLKAQLGERVQQKLEELKNKANDEAKKAGDAAKKGIEGFLNKK